MSSSTGAPAGIPGWASVSSMLLLFPESVTTTGCSGILKGRHKTVEIDADAAQERLCKIQNKTTITGGKVQLNLRYGANIIADNTYKSNDSVVISLRPEDRFKIIEHYPFAAGNMATITGGRHSARWRGSLRSSRLPAVSPTRSSLRTRRPKSASDTVAPYVYMIGKETISKSGWGLEQ